MSGWEDTLTNSHQVYRGTLYNYEIEAQQRPISNMPKVAQWISGKSSDSQPAALSIILSFMSFPK